MNFQQKSVLVTGSARRGGAAIAAAFAAAGARVLIHANTHLDEGERLLSTFPGKGHRLLSADLSRRDAADQLFSAAGKIDILVNNASFFKLRPENSETENTLCRQINYETPKRLMELFAGQKLTEGAVVNILDAAIWLDRHDAYTQSRRDLGTLTLEFARKHGARNLRFNAVAPGPMLPPNELPQSKMEKVLQSVPLHRPVAVDDFVRAVLFLAQCESITGAILPVDGGQHLVITL